MPRRDPAPIEERRQKMAEALKDEILKFTEDACGGFFCAGLILEDWLEYEDGQIAIDRLITQILH